jgi:drug/metabolite transporter (DMT)-like permease
MQPSIPVWGTLLSAALGYERLTSLRAFGILLAVSGAVLMNALDGGEGGEGRDTNGMEFFGTVLIVVQCIAMAFVLVLQKPMVAKYPPSCVTFYYYSFGAVITVLTAITQPQLLNYPEISFHGDRFAWIALGYACVFATLIAYNVYGWALGSLPPGMVTLYCTLQPVGTAILSFFVWGIIPSSIEFAGGSLVALGLLVSVYGRPGKQGDANPSPPKRLSMEGVDSEGTDADLGGRGKFKHRAIPRIKSFSNISDEGVKGSNITV